MPAPDPSALSDRLLLRAAAAGDAAAFSELVTRHQAAVFRFITMLGVSGADAEDALQECFLAAWRFAGGFAGTGEVRSWLFSIARNSVRHQRRRHVDEPGDLLSLEELACRAGWGEPAMASLDEEGADARELVEQALTRLDDDERVVLLLRDLEGLSGEETARALDLTLAAMKSRLHRARLHLAAVVREELHAEP